jgi:hypothetical protein
VFTGNARLYIYSCRIELHEFVPLTYPALPFRDYKLSDLSLHIPASISPFFPCRFRASACGACGACGARVTSVDTARTQRETHTLLSRQASLSLAPGWIPDHVPFSSCSVVSVRLRFPALIACAHALQGSSLHIMSYYPP